MARRALDPAQLAVVRAVRAVLPDADRLFHVRVACSGGADSLALAAGLAWCQRHEPDPLRTASAMVVDHGLQPGSDEVARTVTVVLDGLGLPVDIASVAVDADDPDGVEAAARNARYAALARDDADLVLLGHTMDDQAETVLLGLARGSGTRSLAGMPARFAWADHPSDDVAPAQTMTTPSGGGPVFVRPMLGLRRATTVRACADWGLTPWDDPMNADPRFTRVRARQLMPALETALGPGVVEALARTATLAAQDADRLDAEAVDALPYTDQGTAPQRLPATWLTGLPPALRGRVARRWLAAHGIAELSFDQTRAVLALATDWHGQRGVDLPGGTVVRMDGQLTVAPTAAP